jgi:S-adenosylmethionine:tRNA ribosyltransferase-isomerase
MKLQDFDYDLPPELIAAHPCAERSGSRLLLVNSSSKYEHLNFFDIVRLINPNDLLILNTTKVIKARMYGNKLTGGKVECLIERINSDCVAWAHIKASKSPKIGAKIFINNTEIIVADRHDDLFSLQLPEHLNWDEFLEANGEIPLPPYINRELMPDDSTRYQTVFAKHSGAVAAPTAGLHFTEELIKILKQQGVSFAEVTLHVGAGTFQPVRNNDITNHKMHYERIIVNEECIEKIKQTKDKGGRIIAIGTTVVRAIESAAQTGILQPLTGETNLFLYPGKQIHIIDCLITNFHLPKSSLLMLVSAFAGTDTIKQAYQEAINNKYRFFSYGDAMWLNKLQSTKD